MRGHAIPAVDILESNCCHREARAQSCDAMMTYAQRRTSLTLKLQRCAFICRRFNAGTRAPPRVRAFGQVFHCLCGQTASRCRVCSFKVWWEREAVHGNGPGGGCFYVLCELWLNYFGCLLTLSLKAGFWQPAFIKPLRGIPSMSHRNDSCTRFIG